MMGCLWLRVSGCLRLSSPSKKWCTLNPSYVTISGVFWVTADSCKPPSLRAKAGRVRVPALRFGYSGVGLAHGIGVTSRRTKLLPPSAPVGMVYRTLPPEGTGFGTTFVQMAKSGEVWTS